MKQKRLRWFVILAVIAAVVAFGVRRFGRSRGPKIVYHNATVKRGKIRVTILSTGTVAPENRLDLKPPVGGRIEKVIVQEGQKVRAGQILAWMSSTERATLIDTAQQLGPDEVKYWEDSYKMTPMLAPKNGLIILKSADAGQTVTPTDIVLSMSDRLVVKASVDETDLAQIKEGQFVEVVLDAFPNDVLPSKVYHIGYDAKTVNNVTTYEVDILADKTPDFMKSGMTANATFLVAEKADTLVVPAAAVHREDKRAYVLMPNPEAKDKPIEHDVEVGLSDGKKVEIVSGLNEGDTILMASLSSFAKEDKDVNPFSSFGGHGGGGRR